MRWKRTTEEWELVVEALQEKLEQEHDKRLAAEALLDEAQAQNHRLREANLMLAE